MASGSLASAATVTAGTPLARNPMPGPEPSEKSIELATMACCRRASPPNPMDSTSRPYLAQMPFSLPISIGANAKVVADALPTRMRSAALALAAPAMAAAAITVAANPPRTIALAHIIIVSPGIEARQPSKLCRSVESIADPGKCDTTGAWHRRIHTRHARACRKPGQDEADK